MIGLTALLSLVFTSGASIIAKAKAFLAAFKTDKALVQGIVAKVRTFRAGSAIAVGLFDLVVVQVAARLFLPILSPVVDFSPVAAVIALASAFAFDRVMALLPATPVKPPAPAVAEGALHDVLCGVERIIGEPADRADKDPEYRASLLEKRDAGDGHAAVVLAELESREKAADPGHQAVS